MKLIFLSFLLLAILGTCYSQHRPGYTEMSPKDYTDNSLINTLRGEGISFLLDRALENGGIANTDFTIENINYILNRTTEETWSFDFNITLNNAQNDIFIAAFIMNYFPGNETNRLGVYEYTVVYAPASSATGPNSTYVQVSDEEYETPLIQDLADFGKDFLVDLLRARRSIPRGNYVVTAIHSVYKQELKNGANYQFDINFAREDGSNEVHGEFRVKYENETEDMEVSAYRYDTNPTSPSDNTTSTEEEAAVTPGETTGTEEEAIPEEESTTVIEEETITPEDTIITEETTPENGTVSEEEAITPEEGAIIPEESAVVEEEATMPEDTTVTEEEVTAPEDSITTEETTIIPEESTVIGEETTIVPEESAIVGEEATTPEDTNVIAEEATTIPEESTVTEEAIIAEETTIIPEESVVIGEEATTPEDTNVIAEETTIIPEESTVIGEETITPEDSIITEEQAFLPEESTFIGEEATFSEDTIANEEMALLL